ncbi:MAG: Calx-beta domain-containing protein [Mycobacterium sp.]
MLSAGSSKYIGRVGALAIALGIGGAVAITPGVAWADDSSAPSTDSASSTESAPAPKARAERAHQRTAGREDAAPTRTADSSTRGRGSVDLPAPAPTAPRGSDRGSLQLTTAPSPEVSLAQIDTSSDVRTITAPSPATPAASAVDRFIAAAPRAAAAAAAAAQPAAVSGFLSALSTTLSGNGTGTPAGPLNFLTAALSLVSREINRLTSSYAPVAQSVQTGQQVTAARTTASPTAAASVSSSPSATYAVSSDWGSGFTGNVTVAAGPSALNGWTVSFNTPAEITNIWNGVISSHVGTAYVVTNAPYNGQVSAGQTTSFGFQANTGAAGSAVTGLQVNGAAVVTPPVTPPGASVAGVTAAEPASGTAQAAFTVSLSKASTTPVTIGYATTNGTATAGADFTATTGTLTFAPGVTSQQINVPILADTAVESSETFTVTLSNPTGATIAGATATGTITNTPVTVTPPPTTGSGSVSYTVADNWGSGFTGTMNVTAGQTLNGWTVSFNTPAEITSVWNGVISSHVGTAYVVTNAAWNGQVSAGQSTSFGFQANTGAAGGAITGLQLNGVAVVTPTAPGVSVAGVTAAEPASGTAQAGFTVTLSKASTTPVTVGYATTSGTATAGSDFTATTGTLTFAPGVVSQQINVPILADTVVEPSETFTVTLSKPSGATITTATATATITDSNTAGAAPKVSIADVSVIEGNGEHAHFMFTATLDKASATPVSVGYATSNGTATAGVDYTPASGTITFAPGVTTQTVHVDIIGDTVVEPSETFTVTLSAPTGATIARATATGTIVNDDTAPQTGGTTAQWGNAFFAPYVDMAGWPVPDLVAMSKATGASLFTLGFLQVDPAGNPAWGGYGVLEPNSTDAQAVAINKSIAALRAAGGDVMISFGGAAGTSLAQSYVARGLSAQALANAYAGVVDTYGVTHLDFDIEGAAVADAASIALNSSALKLLQQARPQVQIWYTLPVLPQGLTIDGLNVVQSALTAGVKLAGVNVMAMDYGEGPAPTSGTGAQTMGTYAIRSAESTYAQLSSLYAKNGQTFAWKQIGVTPMIGVNDITSEVFTVADAQALQAFAVSKGLGMLSLWSVERDYPGTLGQPTHNASGVSSPAGSFSGAFNKYGTINVLNYTGGTVTPTPTPVTPGLSISDASASEPGSGGIAAGFLRTSGNQIIDSQGKTVQISGVNWFGMESTTQAPHGLWTRSYKEMINEMAGLGFNTIRLPYSSELLHTTAAPNGIDFSKNPDLQGLSGVQVMDAVIAYAGQQGMRVILDHHRSGAGAGTSDNGLWYDSTYTEDAWVADWVTLANRYKTNSTVIGFDLHNEPHSGVWGGGGATDWARAAERAGNAALAVNPNLLMFVEGVESYQGQNYWWGGNLMGVKDRPIVFNVANRLVYSPHDYPNSVFPQTWFQTADFGAGLPAVFRKAWGYIYEQNIAPIYIGEFGTKLVDPKDAIWLEAITSYISGDLDNNGTKDIAAGNQGINWTFWSWNPNSGDTGGILADDWKTVNQNKMAYLTPIQFSAAGGSSLAAFTVTLSSASASAVTVGYATSNGTATAGSDYTASSGTITFAPGETTRTIAIIVSGDATAEAKETFTVTLSNPSGATLVDGSGAGSITDLATTPTPPVTPVTPVTPVALPKVSIADLAVSEGNGTHAHFMFTATLDKASATAVSVGYATANGTATAGVDYTAAAGTLSFAPGVTTQQVHIDILGDTTVETDETFSVTLSNPSGVSIARATATGNILNDDLATVTPTPPTTGANYVDIMTYGMFHSSSHTGMDALVGGRTAITTEAVVAYNDLRRFAGLAPTTIEDVGRWAFANSMTNNTQASGNDLQGVGLYYAMQGAKVGWIADAKYTPQIVADIERTARLGSADQVMAMVALYGHAGYAKYLIDNGYQTAFINTLKMEPHYGGWMHGRTHGGLIIDGAATAHDVNHLTILSHDQTRPFMNDTFDYPQWPALTVPNTKVIEYFQSMVTLGDPRGTNLTALNSSTAAAVKV